LTKKGLIALSGRRFNRHDEGNCIEDIPMIVDKLREDALLAGLTLEEDDDKWSIGDRFLQKPLLHRDESVRVVFNPTTYTVHYKNGVMGDYMKKITPINNGFFMTDRYGRRITYTLED